MITQTKINMMVIEEGKRWEDIFVYEAIKEWDKGYGGCFAEFMQLYINDRWGQMVMSN